MAGKDILKTPDGRYLIVRDRLWRCADPTIPWDARQAFVKELMKARRAVSIAKSSDELKRARAAVDGAKHKLGERGPVWWVDGEPDLTGKMIQNSPYADWYGDRFEAQNTGRRRSDKAVTAADRSAGHAEGPRPRS
jgi:hypothetical protein